MVPAASSAGPLTLRAWASRLRRTIADQRISTLYQPIVDLSRQTVAGYEALARFEEAGGTGTEGWFVAARACGLGPELEAATLRAALAHRRSLPPNCFMTVNVGPEALREPVVQEVFEGQSDLTGIVIELTEQTPVESYECLQPILDTYREAGALIAVDDVGSGYSGLQHLINLHPSFIKLDRQLVIGIDEDEAKRALADMLGTFADRLDCWLLAEGIERPEELDVLCSLGVPLGQGFLLGLPAPPWAALGPEATELIRRFRPTKDTATLRHLVRPSPTVHDLDELPVLLSGHPGLEVAVLLDRHDRPSGVISFSASGPQPPSRALKMNVDTSLSSAARRAIVRPRESRFHPLVCTDDDGRYMGTVLIERLIERLALDQEITPPAPD